jgi:hypothetical protein
MTGPALPAARSTTLPRDGVLYYDVPERGGFGLE